MKEHVGVEEAGIGLSWARVWDYAALTKPRITFFVVLSTAVGFILGTKGSHDLYLLMHTLLATSLVAGGSAALNQFLERDLDARMKRTSQRPLPSGRLQPEQAYLYGLFLSASGILYLGFAVNWLVGIVAALTTIIYLFLYPPLKQKTSHNTAVGAIAGALPPVGGWAAARGEIGLEAWVLFGIMFLWQFPHFFAIAWLYREDYVASGYRMISAGDVQGKRTSGQIVAFSLALVPFSSLPFLLGLSGVLYLIAASVLTVGLLYFSFTFARLKTDWDARKLMRASLVYLPALWIVMVLDHLAG
jgi:protoheme IX farnesyltransferase